MVCRILIDLDDVLCDCSVTIMHHMGCENWKREDYTLLQRDIVEQVRVVRNINFPNFWNHFNREFWATIPPTPWCYDLLDLVLKYAKAENVAILTTPTNGDCLAGKLDWIEQFMPPWIQRQFIMAPRKEFCAAPGAVLIDDASENTSSFREAGGNGITFPQPWNQCRDRMGLELRYVKGWLEFYSRYSTLV